MAFHIFTSILAILSLTGAFFNARRNILGFYIWAVANLCWALIDGSRGLWAQAAMYTVFLGTNLYGLYYWNPENRQH